MGKGSKGHATTWESRCILKGETPIKPFSWPPKDRDNKLQKVGSGLNAINCPEEYTGELGRSFGNRLKEHLRAPSPIHLHSLSTGCPVSHECFTIVDREAHGVARNIKEVMYIHVNDPSLNRNLGKYQLPHIWDEVLQDTPSL